MSAVDFSAIAGDQFFTIVIPEAENCAGDSDCSGGETPDHLR